MLVGEVMTPDPVCASATSSIREVMEMMYTEDVRHIPIVDGKRLVGMISDSDLREVSVPMIAELESAGRMSRRLGKPISTITSGAVSSVHEESDLAEVIDLMLEQKVEAVPVVERATGDLIGIVSYIDLLVELQGKLTDS